ncbi:MAG: hypothetical protein RLO50_19510 [Azospirillaceae bacterium]
MRHSTATALCAAVVAAACVPAGFPPSGAIAGQPAGPGGIAAGGPGPVGYAQGGYSPIASPREIDDYVRNGSVYAEWYEGGQLAWLECGFFDSGGYYEAILFEAYPDGTYYPDDWLEYGGSWWVSGNNLCFDYGSGAECYLAEWSTGETLLLIDNRDQVAAELITYDGPAEYYDDCFL